MSDKIKFAGSLFARHGGLKTHVEYICKKTFQRINILKALANKTYGTRSLHLTTLMTASTSCLIDYGASVLSSASSSLLHILEVFHTSRLRVALSLTKWTLNLVLLQHAGLPPLRFSYS